MALRDLWPIYTVSLWLYIYIQFTLLSFKAPTGLNWSKVKLETNVDTFLLPSKVQYNILQGGLVSKVSICQYLQLYRHGTCVYGAFSTAFICRFQDLERQQALTWYTVQFVQNLSVLAKTKGSNLGMFKKKKKKLSEIWLHGCLVLHIKITRMSKPIKIQSSFSSWYSWNVVISITQNLIAFCSFVKTIWLYRPASIYIRNAIFGVTFGTEHSVAPLHFWKCYISYTIWYDTIRYDTILYLTTSNLGAV